MIVAETSYWKHTANEQKTLARTEVLVERLNYGGWGVRTFSDSKYEYESIFPYENMVNQIDYLLQKEKENEIKVISFDFCAMANHLDPW